MRIATLKNHQMLPLEHSTKDILVIYLKRLGIFTTFVILNFTLFAAIVYLSKFLSTSIAVFVTVTLVVAFAYELLFYRAYRASIIAIEIEEMLEQRKVEFEKFNEELENAIKESEKKAEVLASLEELMEMESKIIERLILESKKVTKKK